MERLVVGGVTGVLLVAVACAIALVLQTSLWLGLQLGGLLALLSQVAPPPVLGAPERSDVPCGPRR